MSSSGNADWPCARCGNCCRVSGYVRTSPAEVEAIAAHLEMAVDEFTKRYTRLTRDRRGLSLVEREENTCIFLSQEGECGIQDVKPRQCRDFPLGWRFDGYESICAAANAGATNKANE